MASRRLKLVFDENFSHLQVKFIHQQSGLGEIQHTRPMGWSGMPDKDWLPLAIQQEFVIISGDRNEKTRGYTIHDLKGMGARVILVGSFWDNLDRWEKAKWLVQAADGIVAIASSLEAGAAKLLGRQGNTIDL